MTPDEQLQWGSHLPALVACVGATVGQVLELGVGNFSTPVLHSLCAAMDRRLVSVESDYDWFESVGKVYETTKHEFLFHDYEVVVPALAKDRWAVAFIDNSPGGARRANDFAALLPVSQFVVVHDYHGENEEAIGPLLVGVNHCVYAIHHPPTLVASMIRQVRRF